VWTSQPNRVRLSDAAYSLCAALQQSIAELRGLVRTKSDTIAHDRRFFDVYISSLGDFRRILARQALRAGGGGIWRNEARAGVNGQHVGAF
jgi:hypothetical protein